MAQTRLLAAAGILAVLLVATGALAWWSLATTRTETAAVHVVIVGPTGALFDGVVRVENATAYAALRAAAEAGNLSLDVEDYPGMGLYVRAVGGFAAKGPAGWIYEVDRGEGWVSGDRSAARYALHEGEALRWSWTDG